VGGPLFASRMNSTALSVAIFERAAKGLRERKHAWRSRYSRGSRRSLPLPRLAWFRAIRGRAGLARQPLRTCERFAQ
jgi:hypothetical protein